MVFELGFNLPKEEFATAPLICSAHQKNTFTFIRNTKALAGEFN
jgi:hypothetical protein